MCNTVKDLEGRVALVSGASRGIGRAIALKLAQQGARVAVNARALENAEKVAAEIGEMGGDAIAFQADVKDSKSVKDMFSEVTARWEKVDILVNNAGINRDTLLLKMSEEAWGDVIETNLTGAYNCTKMALRSMMRLRWGRIISVASIAGLMGNAGQANYSASKAGLIAFTKSVAKEVGSLNITANAIAPGFIVTDMTDRVPEEMKEAILKMTPLGRYGQPEEVAELVAFLAGDKAAYISGQVIAIDGGIT
ncbi:MAG: 3-oxoacyl-[acyl-carrier-protein] reductase [Dehalococcoidales bacterium]